MSREIFMEFLENFSKSAELDVKRLIMKNGIKSHFMLVIVYSIISNCGNSNFLASSPLKI